MEGNIYGHVKQLTDAERKEMKESRIIPVVASTATKDRSGDILNMKGWDLEHFKANPIIGYQHNVYGAGMCEPADTPDQIIGKGINPRVENDQLLIDIKFKPKGRSELADKVFEDMSEGYLNAVSVGFLAKENEAGEHYRKGDASKGEDPNGKYFFGQQLLELSVVNIPDNPTALSRSLKSQTTNAISFIRKKTGLKFGEIEKMTVGDVIELLETGKKSVKKITTDSNVNSNSDSNVNDKEAEIKLNGEVEQEESRENDVTPLHELLKKKKLQILETYN